jgi:hypothetical protein
MTQNRETAASMQKKTSKANGLYIKVKAGMKSNVEN